ncbi:NAD/FAD-dependent oxidoreductase [Pseudonocardia sp. EC080610-09]|uniref:NAD(P)/FAD-dependent oxidoreductase n=1 Tax=unclassified Pseudonocardia TaxID=2619320 RepID=UPI0006CB57D9|nr:MULTISPECIES: FAD-dependent oxidoreductase [unclassified Pseudonocardia]ALE74592.1 NAD/FAD-dependent oxidoreductase [Pseudonocardia sp. EC080625-04]ALL78016.1 NAD/FAD-dependent oxidoreductase [Pseudonocardia sp. EC080610-09]ALL80929.1 NAD/FAD-dependent oxidoreductase [Pseudonocardia sp. EC080619-01]
MSAPRVVVVGAGIAGVTCAGELAARGADVTVLERARGAGGRLAVHRHDGRPADIGAAYLTVSDDAFADRVDRWRRDGLLREWTDTLAVFDGGTRAADAPGPMRWAAPGGLRSLVADAARDLTVHTGRLVTAVRPGPDGRPLVDGEPCDAVVLAMPDPQAARLLDPGTPAGAAVAGRKWNPVLALTLGFAHHDWPALPAAFVNEHPVLSLVADDGDRRGDDAPVLVAHSTGDVARRHDADPAAAVPAMTAAVQELLGIGPGPEWTHVHRWRYAAPADQRSTAFHLDDENIALAGDGWGRSRVETAWLSGRSLGHALATRLAL